jgi:hypothetical protein
MVAARRAADWHDEAAGSQEQTEFDAGPYATYRSSIVLIVL